MAVIPDKLYFKIGEVCKLAEVKPHVLRYWEAEFPSIRPKRATSKQRLYRRVDVENILKIKDLLYREGFTIAGARKALNVKPDDEILDNAEEPVSEPGTGNAVPVLSISTIKQELQALQKLLDE